MESDKLLEQLFLIFLKNKVAYVPYHNLKDYLVSRGVVLISFRIPVTNQETREFQVGVSFLDSSKSSRKDLWRVGTNTWVSGMRILRAHTLTRLFSESGARGSGNL